MDKNKQPVKSESVEAIEEKKRIENALRESEARYRQIFDQNQAVKLIIDPDTGRILEANRAAASFYGYPVERLQQLNISDINQLDPAQIATEMKAALNEHRNYFVFPHRLASGEVRQVEVYSSPIDLAGRRVLYSIVHDITVRRLAEESLKTSEEQYRLLAENASDVIWTADMRLNPTYISPSVYAMQGHTPEEAMNLTAEQRYTPESLKLISKRFIEVMANEEAGMKQPENIGNYEAEYIRKDGSTYWTETKASLIRDATRKATGILGVTRDISKRKQMEDALRNSEDKYRNLVELLHEGIWVIDNDNRTTYVNARMAEMLGYTVQEMQGKELLYFMDDMGRELAGQQMKRRREGISETHEFEFVRKDGKRICTSISTTPITDKGGKYRGAIAGIQDITDRKNLEEERQRVARLESVGLLASGIAHDFNNILTSVLGNISLARSDAAPGSELHESLEQAEKASLRAKALTVQLLTFSKGGTPVKKLASLAELINDTAGFALSGSKVKCQYSIPADLWHAEIDAGQISQVIHNLVINAKQAMPNGGTVEINADNVAANEIRSLSRGLPLKDGNYVRIAVADHGMGIPEEHLKKVFDPFFSTKQEGSGLGLATSFSIARQHGGHICVESRVGSGSTFCIYLPASMETFAPRQDKKDQLKPAGNARILVMDDEQGIIKVAIRMLKHIGYDNVDHAADGAEAIKLYKAAMKTGSPFSMVILDLTVPGGMGGELTIKKLLKIDPAVKALVSSGYADDPVVAGYRKYGFSGMIIKPYSIEELGKALQEVK